jgi:hypothetical protein
MDNKYFLLISFVFQVFSPVANYLGCDLFQVSMIWTVRRAGRGYGEDLVGSGRIACNGC